MAILPAATAATPAPAVPTAPSTAPCRVLPPTALCAPLVSVAPVPAEATESAASFDTWLVASYLPAVYRNSTATATAPSANDVRYTRSAACAHLAAHARAVCGAPPPPSPRVWCRRACLDHVADLTQWANEHSPVSAATTLADLGAACETLPESDCLDAVEGERETCGYSRARLAADPTLCPSPLSSADTAARSRRILCTHPVTLVFVLVLVLVVFPAHIYLAAFLAAGTVLLVLLGVAFCYRRHTQRRRARLAAEIRAQLPPKMPPVPDIVEEADLDTPAPGPESMHRPPAMISTNQVCVRRKVWLPYTPILQDELRLFEGEWVTVLEYFDGHWARGRNALGHEGHFPVYCLEPEAQIDI